VKARAAGPLPQGTSRPLIGWLPTIHAVEE